MKTSQNIFQINKFFENGFKILNDFSEMNVSLNKFKV